MIETLQRINDVVPNLTVSQLLEIINIINKPKLTIDNMVLKSLKEIPHNGFIVEDVPNNELITMSTNDNKTTSTVKPFSIDSYYL